MQVTRWAAAALMVTALSGCAGGVSGSGSAAPPSSAPHSSAAPSSAPHSSAPPSSGSAPSKEVSAPTLRDFTKATYTVPRGFVRAYSYREAVDLEQHYQAYYFVPKSAYNGQDVLTVIVYTLPADAEVATPQQQSDRVDLYNKKLAASLPNGTRDSTIAGLPAFEENVVQPPDYHYSTWFAFGAKHMLQFSCQVGTTRSAAPVISTGCQQMHDSIRVS